MQEKGFPHLDGVFEGTSGWKKEGPMHENLGPHVEERTSQENEVHIAVVGGEQKPSKRPRSPDQQVKSLHHEETLCQLRRN